MSRTIDTDSIAELLAQPIRVGRLQLPNRVFLAPLAGVSDVPFRRICQEMGAGFTSVEMLSAAAVLSHARRTTAMLARHEDEPVVGVQVTGPTPEKIASAVRDLDATSFEAIDLNMGCPVRKVAGRGSGAGLLRDPAVVEDAVIRSRDSTAKPLSAKIRLGLSTGTVNVEETSIAIARAGANLITIHGRTRCQRYDVPADLALIRDGIKAARRYGDEHLVAVGNGDILDRKSGYRMMEQTGCDAVMISRGALGNPWIFGHILQPAAPEPSIEEWSDVLLRHASYHEAHYANERLAPILFRKHLLWYLRGFPGVRRMRAACSVVESMDEVARVVLSFTSTLPSDLRRFEDRDIGATADGETFDPKSSMDRSHDRGVGEVENSA
jgi:nifR3 family TIM-barrel protein